MNMVFSIGVIHGEYTTGQTHIQSNLNAEFNFHPGDPIFDQLYAAMEPWTGYQSPTKSLNATVNLALAFFDYVGQGVGTDSIQHQNVTYRFLGYYDNPSTLRIYVGTIINVPTACGWSGSVTVDATVTGDISLTDTGTGDVYLTEVPNGNGNGDYTIVLSASPLNVQYGDTVTLQATLRQNGTLVVGAQLDIYYKNPNDSDFAPLVTIGPTDGNGTVSYGQPVDSSWFREATCQLKAVYLGTESNIVTLTLSSPPPPPIPAWQGAALVVGIIATGIVGVVIVKRKK